MQSDWMRNCRILIQSLMEQRGTVGVALQIATHTDTHTKESLAILSVRMGSDLQTVSAARAFTFTLTLLRFKKQNATY